MNQSPSKVLPSVRDCSILYQVKNIILLSNPMQALRSLLSGVIDYAGLFPPASLSMSAAVANYAAYRTGENAWMLGRFIVPVVRLEEFSIEVKPFLSRSELGTWLLSALCATPHVDISAIRSFNEQHRGTISIDTVEVKASTVENIESLFDVKNDVKMFVEIPVQQDPRDLLLAIKKAGASAKVRTGGTTADGFPSSEDLANFITLCVKLNVEFKATAGLHHPLKSVYRLTYEPDSVSGKMFGFLNVFLATALALSGGSIDLVAKLLNEEDHRRFSFDDEAISWNGHRFENAQLHLLRRETVASFGSCSFVEPVEDLEKLGLL
jgi:hypothetical protein